MCPRKKFLKKFRKWHIWRKIRYNFNMKEYWRIAIAVRATVLDKFNGDLDEYGRTILGIADEIRENEHGRLWLFKYQMWGDDDPIIAGILSALRSLNNSDYMYATLLKARHHTKIEGSFPTLDFFRPEMWPITGLFFEEINFWLNNQKRIAKILCKNKRQIAASRKSRASSWYLYIRFHFNNLLDYQNGGFFNPHNHACLNRVLQYATWALCVWLRCPIK